MAGGNYGGNGSIHSELYHGPSGSRRELTTGKPVRPPRGPQNDQIDVQTQQVLGEDPTPVSEIKTSGAPWPQMFKITLRYAVTKPLAVKEPAAEVARQALQALVAQAREAIQMIDAGQDAQVVAFVPVMNRGTLRPPYADWEVSVVWDE